jgi:gliding motility-associated protein GldM
MSIPKEPRQLMINLMYLVLTALLALNVSAEVMNAFFALDKGIKNSNDIVDTSNGQVKSAIDEQVKAYNSQINQNYQSAANKAIEIVNGFCDYIKGMNDMLVQNAGGVDPKFSDGRPKDIKNKDVTTRIFVKEGKGAEIEAKIKETRESLLALMTDPKDRAEVEKLISLGVEEIPAGAKSKNWVEYKFKQMPVAAVVPFFTKLKADAKTSQTAILNQIFKRVGGTDIKFDKFLVAISPNNGYVIEGEKFTADIALAAYSSNPGTGVSITANGAGLPVKEGVAHYETTASGIGKKTLVATASIKNPLTGQTETAKKEFNWEVGRRSVAVSADKMNVFYIGVDNPLSVAAAGVSSNELRVSASGGGASLSGSGSNYVCKVTTPGEAQINVSGGGLNQSFKFRVKRIPDPFAQLPSNDKTYNRGGAIGNGTMKAMSSVVAVLDNFDFEAKCNIQGFDFTFVAKRQDPVTYPNQGGSFNSNVAGAIQKSKPGDVLYFDNIKGRCPGDAVGRELNSLVFKIK